MEPWGGVGQVRGVQHFIGALLCPWDAPVEGMQHFIGALLCTWDAPVEVQALCNCCHPPLGAGL